MTISHPSPAPSKPVWAVARRPRGGRRLVHWLVALAVVGASAGFGTMLDLERQSWVGLGIGLALGVVVLLGTGHGSRVEIDGHGMLHYSFAGQRNCSLPLAAIQAVAVVADGYVAGVGLRLDVGRIQFHHRQGWSYRSMERLRASHGVDLLLEDLTADDARVIEERRLAIV